MIGYIIDVKSVRDEDLLVTILTKDSVITAYRFYGARHSNINIGYKIDFELEESIKVKIKRLKDVLHIGYDWILDNDKMYMWQIFIKLLFKHLRDIDEIDSFYFDLLSEIEVKLSLQNTKRAIIEKYVQLLDFEGRLHSDLSCFVCENEINSHISLTRSFLPAHQKCINRDYFEKFKVQELFCSKSTFLFDNDEVATLWEILQEGI
jgi:recombinational DNA repair protein (RecF pathway)